MARLLKVRCREIFLGRGEPSKWLARLSDFVPVQRSQIVNEEVSVLDMNFGDSVPDPVELLQKNGARFTVYSFDSGKRVLGLIKVREGIDIRTAPFLFQAQRENAEELLIIPFDVLPAVADALSEKSTLATVKNIFLYNTGRCGSTLMCRVLDVFDNIQAVAEPYIFALMFKYATRDFPLTSVERENIIMLLRCSVVLLNFHFQQKDPSKTVICYKLRSEAVFVAGLIQKAVPASKTIFMYRDLPGFYDSYLDILFSGSYWRYFSETTLRLDVLFRVPAMKNEYQFVSYAAEHPRMITCPVTHGVPFVFVSLWILQMQKAFDLNREDSANFFHACLTFKQLLEHKERIILKVLEKLDVDVPPDLDSSRIRDVFAIDSQKGSAMQSTRGRGNRIRNSWVGTWERNLFSIVLGHFNGDVDKPNFNMPNSITID
ncbi:uncharacterized protein [Branchiostoma lanceolatum]|uniref:uncharacterized protein n=1 Tax=Branchiostoma lanceolatum TaxID=7740 RepID=UPI0034567CC8